MSAKHVYNIRRTIVLTPGGAEGGHRRAAMDESNAKAVEHSTRRSSSFPTSSASRMTKDMKDIVELLNMIGGLQAKFKKKDS
jgi:hypothetical protein